MSRILLFEKNAFLRESLLQILKCRFSDEAAKCVLSREECLTELSTFMPDILLMGPDAYNGNKLDLLDDIHQGYPSVSIIFFNDYNIDEYRKEAILKGASHVISRDLWTGNEILALIDTIITSKESLKHRLAENLTIEKNFLEQPIERRRRDPKGKAIESKFLVHHPDRRSEKTKLVLSDRQLHSFPHSK